jgi:hypothetical protein
MPASVAAARRSILAPLVGLSSSYCLPGRGESRSAARRPVFRQCATISRAFACRHPAPGQIGLKDTTPPLTSVTRPTMDPPLTRT